LKREEDTHRQILNDGSKIAVIGGGPAGSFFSFFLFDIAKRVGLDIHVDIYESRNFSTSGPPGCNMCGGIISESLVQTLASEGIILPSSVVQKGIESYVLHTNEGSVHIRTPTNEKRIGAVFRGKGPKGMMDSEIESFDGYLLGLACEKGAKLIKGRVEKVSYNRGFPEIQAKGTPPRVYDLLGVATGVNSSTLKLFENLNRGYSPPVTIPTYIFEYLLGREIIEKQLGSSMHTFLLDLQGFEFAAVIPKGEYVTACLLGTDLDAEGVESFFSRREVKACFPPEWDWKSHVCHCRPKMNIKGSPKTYLDRIVFIGDSGISRLYKDGIGAAYRSAKAAVSCVVFKGLGEEDFAEKFGPSTRKMEADNRRGKLIFSLVGIMKRIPLIRRAILSMASKEQKAPDKPQRLSLILWDLFTGSTSYKEIFFRLFHPIFLAGFFWNTVSSLRPKQGKIDEKDIESEKRSG